MVNIFKAFSSIVLLLLLTTCSNTNIDNIDRGAGYNYRPGYPELRLASTGFISEDDSTRIIVSGHVVYGSLVYAEKNGNFDASFTIDIAIYEDNKQRKKVNGIQFSQTINTKNNDIINSQEVHTFEKVFKVPPGSYIIEGVIFDNRSKRQSSQINRTTLPDPSDEQAHVTEIRILAKDVDDFIKDYTPVTTYDIPARFDSLQFIFQITNNKEQSPLTLESRLIRFKADTTAARPLHFSSPSQSSIQHRGIEYDDFEEVQSSRRTINQEGSVIIEVKFTSLPKGNYRFEVRSSGEGDEKELYKARDFGIKSENYPTLGTAKELANPLVYLMDEKEYENLMSINEPVALKKAVDRFWLQNTGNSNEARQVIALYYQRVEEANKQFSNFKAGWKTDPGMIYILFGPPWYVDSFADQMVWSYTYNRDNPEKNFRFESPKLRNKFFPFEHYIVNRSVYYHNIYYQQVEMWRNGNILRSGL